jgi:hypothetical protein
MKLKTLCLSVLFLTATWYETNADYQQYCQTDLHNQEIDRLSELIRPIRFTRHGIQTFLQDSFNASDYAEQVLCHSFSHLIQFLEYGKVTKQNVEYVESSIRLFLNKLKRVRFIPAESAERYLDRMPQLLCDYFKSEEAIIEQAKQEIKRILYERLLNQYSLLKQEPDTFMTEVSDQIYKAVQSKSDVKGSVSKEQCRQLNIRFLETMLGKLMWNVADQVDVWTSFKCICNQLGTCKQAEIINLDELDDLLKSVLERFIFFLELRGSDLSHNVIELIKADIASGTLLIATIEEQEEFIESKIKRLEGAIMETEAKILAREKGIITDSF